MEVYEIKKRLLSHTGHCGVYFCPTSRTGKISNIQVVAAHCLTAYTSVNIDEWQ
jgi:hypothetical protein